MNLLTSDAKLRWTSADMPNQTGRRILVTGGNSGIGWYAALELARKGAHVILASRDQARGERAVEMLRREVHRASAEFAPLDLASLASVHEFVARQGDQALDVLVNNAGVMAPKKRLETQDGFELQFGTNVLGHFALTALLMPALTRAAAMDRERPRVVTIASIAHKRGKLHFDDLQWRKSYSPMAAYQQSKLANLMLALELDRRLRGAAQTIGRIMSVAAHPGVANTNLFQAGQYGRMEKLARRRVGVGHRSRIKLSRCRCVADALCGDSTGSQEWWLLRSHRVPGDAWRRRRHSADRAAGIRHESSRTPLD